MSDGDLREPGLFLPIVVHLQFRVVRVIDPLVEELVMRASRKLLDDGAQILGHHIAVSVSLQVRPDATPVKFLAQLRAEHVQHPAALRIGEVTEHFTGRIVSPADNRVGVIRHARDLPGALIKFVQHRVAPVFVAVIERLVVRGETFVEPDVAPILARDEVAEPLVRHLVRNQAFAVANVLRCVGKKRVVGQRRATGVLHAAGHKIIHANLIILRPGIRHADFLLEKRHDVFRVAERAGRFVDFRRGRVKCQRDVVVFVLDFFEKAGHERDQVVGMGFVLRPVNRHQPRHRVLLL